MITCSLFLPPLPPNGMVSIQPCTIVLCARRYRASCRGRGVATLYHTDPYRNRSRYYIYPMRCM